MRDGFIKCAAAGIKIQVANPEYNTQIIMDKIAECVENKAKVIVFPQLALSGYTCGDLFLHEQLIESCKEGVKKIVAYTADKEAIVFVGFPYELQGNLYNAAAVISKGQLLGIVPKTELQAHDEFSEMRYFVPGQKRVVDVLFDGKKVPFGTGQLFQAEQGLCVGCEIGEDAGAPVNPGTYHVLAGANLLVNLSASCEVIGRNDCTYWDEKAK